MSHPGPEPEPPNHPPRTGHDIAPSLFLLPTPEEAEGLLDLPEPPMLRHGARDRRLRIKRGFWRTLVRPLSFRPEFGHKSVVRELIPPERRRQLEQAGLYRDPRMAEQPRQTEESLLERVPQFTLRNLPRMEKDAWVDDLFWERQVLRDLQHELGLDEIRKLRILEPPEWHTTWNLEVVCRWLQERRELLGQIRWSELSFKGGRPAERRKKEGEGEGEGGEGEGGTPANTRGAP